MNSKTLNNKSLSIRVTPNGLSFCVYSPQAAQPFTYKEYDVQPTISLAANLKEALTGSEPLLQEQYQRVNVLVTTPKFTLVPVVDFKAENAKEIYVLNFPKDNAAHVTYNVLRRSGIAIIFGIDRNIHQLILDDFPRARFYASAATLIEFFAEKSMAGTEKKMFAYLHEREMTIYAYTQGRMIFSNQFKASQTIDCQYYILNAFQHLEFNQLEDSIYIVGETGKENELADKLTNFVGYVNVIDRKEDFEGYITEGNNIPYDLQTLLVCGF